MSNNVVLADFDLDGDLDAFVINYKSTNRLWINNGNGKFEASQQDFNPYGFEPAIAVAAGDIDGTDGPDIILEFLNAELPGMIYVNDGHGQFTKRTTAVDTTDVYRIELSDLNSDGLLDVFLALRGYDDEVWLNDGNGNFAATSQRLEGEKSVEMVATDINGDGHNDAIIGSTSPYEIRIWTNDGTGRFERTSTLDNGTWVLGLAVGDVNGDETPDIITNDSGGGSTIWFNDGMGNFTKSDLKLNQYGGPHVVLADFDADGNNDLLYANDDEEPDLFLKNDGTGKFAGAEELEDLSMSHRIAVGDLDNDGDLDVFFANDGANTVWLNQLISTSRTAEQ